MVVTRAQNGESQANVSHNNAVAQSTIRGWLKDEQKQCNFVDTVDSSEGMKRKKARTANSPELDKAVLTWFVRDRLASPLVALF